MSILDVLPSAKPLTLNGKTYLCGQLTVKDWASLQQYVESKYPHPLDAHRDELDALEGKERRQWLARLQVADHDYPPKFPCVQSDHLFRTVEGLAFWLMVMLRHHNDIKAHEAVTLADAITLEELAALERIAYDVSPSTQLYRMIYPDQLSSSADADWASMIDEVSVSHGWTYEQVGDLTLSQFSVALTGHGRTRKTVPDVSHLSEKELHEMLKQQRADLGYVQEVEVD